MKFEFTADVTISIHTTVEAEDEGTAMEIAESRAMPSLCYRCSRGNDQETWVTSGILMERQSSSAYSKGQAMKGRTVTFYEYDRQLRPGTIGADFDEDGDPNKAWTLRFDHDDPEDIERTMAHVARWILGDEQ